MIRNAATAFTSLVIALVAAPGARAAWRPSFDITSCAWFATHIVVADEGDKIDGVLTVLESWKGDLKPGDTVWLPDLAKLAPEKERVIQYLLNTPDQIVTGRRMVLFLRKMDHPWHVEGGLRDEWLPTNRESLLFRARHWNQNMAISVAWVEPSGVYGLQSVRNSNMNIFCSYFKMEGDVRQRVKEIVVVRERFGKALATVEPTAREAAVMAEIRATQSDDGGLLVSQLVTLLDLGDMTLLQKARDAVVTNDWQRSRLEVAFLIAEGRAYFHGSGYELLTILRKAVPFWRAQAPLVTAHWQPTVDRGNPAEKLWRENWTFVNNGLNHYPRNSWTFRELSLAERIECLKLVDEMDAVLGRMVSAQVTQQVKQGADEMQWFCKGIRDLLRPTIPQQAVPKQP